ncbi:HAD family hydrolase [Methylocapsa palsarum]|uniref:Putative hydrolase of the HAD superfamily n=1 Tax=Methylocapsa palsarum TaxID=1612308 RepID=A0A1I3VU34_9HYPH|nr:HAD family phosphatase [Methylocapsa palsarum]SFJ98918.1 putative hydrolase of the HAD superfamily [Methylocapsa palsarum]
MTDPTIIFDLGGVLVRHDNDLLFDRLAACCPDPQAARPHMEAWLHAEDVGTGRLGVEALHQRLAAEHGFNAAYPRFLELWNSHFSPEPGMEPLVRSLAAPYRVVIFSNTNAAHIDHIRDLYPAFGHAHTAYLSYELGLVKPDPASYRRVLELERRAPQDCIFIDDRADNTAAAAALGMKTVTFTGVDSFLAAMAGHGVRIER